MAKTDADKLIANLKSITDSQNLTDAIVKGEKVQLFRCAGSGLFFPGDYLNEWGRKYGHGLGRTPVSECLETDWYREVAQPDNLLNEEQIMYPIMQGNHPIDAYIVDLESFKGIVEGGQMAVLMKDDPFLVSRAKILRNKQLENPNKRLKTFLNIER